MIPTKPLPPKPPKPKRLEGPKRVTIAAGFVCMDGVVVCADTQESTIGYTKNTTEKMSLWCEKNFTLAVTGSGDTENVESVTQCIMDTVKGEYTPNNYLFGDEAKELIGDAFLRFFERHLLPYPHDERPFIELLIAIQCYHNRYLLKASGNTVRDLDPAVSLGADCIGSGAMLARSLIEKLYSSFSELDDLVVVACYVIYQAKKWVDGCGGNTDPLVLTKELRIGLPSSNIEALEKLFDRYDEQFGDVLTRIANPNSSNADAAKAIQSAGSSLLEFRSTLAQSNPRLVEFFRDIQGQKALKR